MIPDPFNISDQMLESLLCDNWLSELFRLETVNRGIVEYLPKVRKNVHHFKIYDRLFLFNNNNDF